MYSPSDVITGTKLNQIGSKMLGTKTKLPPWSLEKNEILNVRDSLFFCTHMSKQIENTAEHALHVFLLPSHVNLFLSHYCSLFFAPFFSQ